MSHPPVLAGPQGLPGSSRGKKYKIKLKGCFYFRVTSSNITLLKNVKGKMRYIM